MREKKFYWGASTSAFQVEGGYGEGGKGIATTDVRNVPKGIADSKIASDHYHHMLEDIDLMKELGINLYRFSFNWTRVMGDGYEPNPEGIEFYNRLINKCIENGIEPFPTLYHFEMPQAFVTDFDGWHSRKCIDQFVKYAEVCFRNFGDRIKMWGTINEQLIVTAAPDLNGNHEPDFDRKMKNMYQMSYHMSLAEKKTIHKFREIVKDGQIGPVCSMQVVYPESPSPENVLAAKNAEDLLQNCFLDMSVLGKYPMSYCNYLKGSGWFPQVEPGDKEILESNKPDMIGINYYCSTCVRSLKSEEDNSNLPPFYRNNLFTLGSNPYLPKTKWMEFGIDPEGLYIGIRDIYEKYNLPMIITENGLAYSDKLENCKVHDEYRIEYLDQHINQCERLLKEGYPILGYCPWSLIDLVSSHQGFQKRYGLIYIDRTDEDPKECRRIPKDSYYWYKNRILACK
ncbi:Aryl-phospho-beta-D-glucosidase BglC [bioreactor metagenome]|uniref:Aryl-phospho-beta-D-glucosidase BglC n=1 Tax=bioreactor metagenome TaxID=1076179 RepID=A0A644XK88_9ZZZZ